MDFPWQTSDPFLFCAHHRDEYPAGNERMGVDLDQLKGRNVGQDFTIKDGWRMYHGSTVPGFPHHPHRGFETITINKEGFVDHTDSLGAAGRFGAGDVQWMTAGKGIQHSEMFPLIHQEKDNHLEIFQIWLNLPKAKKFVEPHFKMLWADSIPLVKEKDKQDRNVEVNVIAGHYKGAEAPAPTPDSWAANPEHGVCLLTIKMDAHAEWTLPAANTSGVNRTLYFYRGDVLQVEGQHVKSYHSIQVNPEADIRFRAGGEDVYLLMLQGKPIGEPVAKYGPFVMNTQQEIYQAIEDYQKTEYGGWPWPEREYVHDRNKGRFALHADGREEVLG